MRPKLHLDNKLVWRATQNQESLTTLNPDAILARGYYHELFLSLRGNLQGYYPTSVLLPFIAKLASQQDKNSKGKFVVFLGEDLWPTPFCLRDLLANKISLTKFLFIDSPNQKKKERALEILARSSNVLAVVSSLQKVSFAFTQKLYLFSKESGAYTFLFRELKELSQKSAALSRWEVAPVVSKTDFPSWSMTLRHIKGSYQAENIWLMEGINEKEVSVHLLSELVNKSCTEGQSGTEGFGKTHAC